MLEVTPAATTAMVDHFKDKEKKPVRILMLTGGCGIRYFGVAMEDSRPNDDQFDVEGITYLIDHKILEDFGPIKVDSDGFSFRLSGVGIDPPNSCGTCAFGCGPRGKMRCAGNCRSCSSPCPTGRRLLARRKSYAAFTNTH